MFVLTAPMRVVEAQFDAPAHRFTDQELADIAQPRAPQPASRQSALDRQRKAAGI